MEEDEIFQEDQEIEVENQEVPSINENDVSNVDDGDSSDSIPQDDESLPFDEDTIIVNENTIEEQLVDYGGQVITLDEALYREQIKTNFYLSLILIVTVVFFIINKFWAWCRRLFTTQV